MEILKVEKLWFDYPNKTVLKDIDFRVAAGAICGLLGPNASGKTTLLKCINGLFSPSSGNIIFNGRSVGSLNRRSIAEIMAVVPQLTHIAFSFTAIQMVVMGRIAKTGAFAKPTRKDNREAHDTLDDLGIGHLADREFNELSGGEKQMVLLARALFQEPRLLLLDEPTSHLDFRNQHVILEAVRTLTRAKNLTTLVTLHDPNLAARYCTDMVMMKKGRVHHCGDTQTVFVRNALESVYDMKVSVTSGSQGQYMVVPFDDAKAPTWH